MEMILRRVEEADEGGPRIG
jgi:hypothetical protein